MFKLILLIAKFKKTKPTNLDQIKKLGKFFDIKISLSDKIITN
jgi:hypothetical protein